MTTPEKQAYEAGLKAKQEGRSFAACYDETMQRLVFNPSSEAGKDRLSRIFKAWAAGCGIDYYRED